MKYAAFLANVMDTYEKNRDRVISFFETRKTDHISAL